MQQHGRIIEQLCRKKPDDGEDDPTNKILENANSSSDKKKKKNCGCLGMVGRKEAQITKELKEILEGEGFIHYFYH